MQNHRAVVTVILTECCTLGTQQHQDSNLIYLSEVALWWTHARTIFHFSQQSRAPLLFCVLPALFLAPFCLLVLLHPHSIPGPIPASSRSALHSFMWVFLGAFPQFEKSYTSQFHTEGMEGSRCSSRSPSPACQGSPGIVLFCARWWECNSASEHKTRTWKLPM